MRIPAKANSIPEGSRTGFRAGPEQQSERSDAGFLIVQEVFGLVKETDVPEEVRSEAEAGDSELGKGCGERDSSPVPRSVLELQSILPVRSRAVALRGPSTLSLQYAHDIELRFGVRLALQDASRRLLLARASQPPPRPAINAVV